MKFKRYHQFIQAGVFVAVFEALIIWTVMIGIYRSHVSIVGTKIQQILELLFFIFAPFIQPGIFLHGSMLGRDGHISDVIEINHKGVRLYSKKGKNLFLPWEYVYEIIEVNHPRGPNEMIVRGINGEIDFCGPAKVKKYLTEKIGVKLKQAPSDWRRRTDWREK